MNPFLKILSYLFVGALWGITNPFLKQNTNNSNSNNNSNEIKEKISLIQRFQSLFFLFIKPGIFLPIFINQLGSIAFYYLLATDDISIAVPLCNSLTFAFTGITGWFLGEKIQQPILFLIGILLILCGIYLCVIS